ncbi:MAG TPA: hypothetical protein VI759_06800 [Dehalococcoidia bacterium]|nr:hypothetical protein [Dehalococcoidia bacterium]
MPEGRYEGPPPNFYRPRESERGTYTEKKFGDEMTAVWYFGNLPKDALVTHVTLIPYRRDKVVLAWRNGVLSMPEGDVAEGESVDQAIGRIAALQTGIADATVVPLGHFRVLASARSTTRPAGTITYQALFGLEVKEIADFPGDQSYERRIVLQRELNEILRTSHVEHRLEYTHALDGWLIERLKAQQTR